MTPIPHDAFSPQDFAAWLDQLYARINGDGPEAHNEFAHNILAVLLSQLLYMDRLIDTLRTELVHIRLPRPSRN